MKKYLLSLFTLLSTFHSFAANTDNSLPVSGVIEKTCQISISNINFGELIFSKSGDSFSINNTNGSNVVTATSSLNLICNNQLPISYSFFGGNSNSDYVLSPIDYDGTTKRAFAMKQNNSNVFYHFITNFNHEVNSPWGSIPANSDFAHFIDGSIRINEIFNPNYNQRTVKALIAPIINPYFPQAGNYSDTITMKLDF